MAGHNNWSMVKRWKRALDAQRGRLISRASKEITVTARLEADTFRPQAGALLR